METDNEARNKIPITSPNLNLLFRSTYSQLMQKKKNSFGSFDLEQKLLHQSSFK